MDSSKMIPAAILGLPLAMVVSLVFFVLILGGNSAAACGAGAGGAITVGTITDEPIAGYEREQLVNAAHIMNAAHVMGLSSAAQTIGVMVAMGESSLTVLDHGDTAGPDSRGLFQQRNNWGSLEDRMNPTTSATLFFTALLQVEGWEELQPTIAAHRVQGNADPFHYERFYPAAQTVVSTLAGDIGSSVCLSGDTGYPLDQPYNMTDDYGARGDTGVAASTQHAAIDLQNWPNPLGQPVYAIQSGTVVLSDGLYLSIKHPDGYVISYLHMRQSDHLVSVGEQVAAGQQIGSVGNEGPSSGPHLDVRIKVTGSTNDAVAQLPVDPGVAAAGWGGYVNPEEFFALWGVDICPEEWCTRNYS